MNIKLIEKLQRMINLISQESEFLAKSEHYKNYIEGATIAHLITEKNKQVDKLLKEIEKEKTVVAAKSVELPVANAPIVQPAESFQQPQAPVKEPEPEFDDEIEEPPVGFDGIPADMTDEEIGKDLDNME